MADSIMEGTHPTRMELFRIKNRLRIARKGHKLLKEKRDTLSMEFMRLAREAGQTGGLASKQLERARESYAVSNALAGSPEVMSAALAAETAVTAEVDYRNIMGIELPTITVHELKRRVDQRGFGLITTHPTIDEAAAEYEKAILLLAELASTEHSLQALSDEVKKTKRRVNALEYNLIPKLQGTQKYITMRLEELAREGFYHRKLIKSKRMRDET